MLILTLKKIVQKIPYFPGVFLKYIPFSWKVGGEYLNQRNKLFKFNDSRNINYVLHNLNFIVNYALSNFEFYRNFYGVTSYSIKSIDDFQKLPILTKEDARILAKEVSNGYLKLNTGGSTGKPLSFYIDSNGLAREWSHLHFIWKDYGYNPRQLMLTALGARTNNLTFVHDPLWPVGFTRFHQVSGFITLSVIVAVVESRDKKLRYQFQQVVLDVILLPA